MFGALCVMAIAYRYYSAFIAARVLCLDDARVTPAHRLNDGHDYVPTHRWVLFGHHFAAISGSGPLIGPTLAAQFGFAPGFLWILCGVVLAGAVHDFVILTASVRRDGRSLAALAREELGPVPGLVARVAILAIVVVAIAGLGIVVVGALAESAWGSFTVAASVPIALGMGAYNRFAGKERIGPSTVVGVVLLFAALVYGRHLQQGPFGHYFRQPKQIVTLAIAAYGFIASVLPVWLLLCPRDYLSSYLKIGTIALLVVGVLVVNPRIEAPMVSQWVHGGGAIVRGPLFPFVFVTIACGAISGFHALIASGTTPRMISRESDCRIIGYGAMLMEGIVGLTALIAATSLPVADYYAINTDPPVALFAQASTVHATGLLRDVADARAVDAALSPDDRVHLGLRPQQSIATLQGRAIPLSRLLGLSNRALAAAGYHCDPRADDPATLSTEDFARLGVPVNDLPMLAASTHERIAARTGGGVSLGVGMARIFSGLPGLRGHRGVLAYWYHFAVMFEALFILTTIDTGTRVGRFLVEEFMEQGWAALGFAARRGGLRARHPRVTAVIATLAVVSGWTGFLWTGSVQTIWPMFGVANQLLAVISLTVGTTLLLRTRGARYAWVTGLPLIFVGTVTITAGFEGIRTIYLPLAHATDPARSLQGWVDTGFTAALLACVGLLLAVAIPRWVGSVRRGPSPDVPMSTVVSS